MIEMRQIKDFPNYLVTRDGRVWSKKFNNSIRGGFLKEAKRGDYLKVCLGYGKQFSIHRLVAQAFIPNPQNKPQVNHINGNKYDNRVENLEWATHSDNQAHSRRVLKNDGRLKKPVLQIKNGNVIKQYPSATIAAKENNFHQGAISSVCRGEVKTHKGFKWEYLGK